MILQNDLCRTSTNALEHLSLVKKIRKKKYTANVNELS